MKKECIPVTCRNYLNTHAKTVALAVKAPKAAGRGRPMFVVVTSEDVERLLETPMFYLGTDGVARYASRERGVTERDLAKAGVKPLLWGRCRPWHDNGVICAAMDFERAVTEALNDMGYAAKWVGGEHYFGGTREAARDIDTTRFGRVECKADGGRLAKWLPTVENPWD